MKTNTKKLCPLSKFIYWIILFIIICIIGISNVFADEIVNLGYITDHSNLVLINTSFGMTSDLPVNQVSTQDFTINQIDLYISYSFGANNVYLIELSTPNAVLQNIDNVSIVGGSTYCSFLGLDTSNVNYPNIKFTCPNSVNLLSVSLSNSNGNSITSTNSFRWNYSYLRQIKSTIDIGPIINSQTQNTQDIINNNNQNTDKIIEGLNNSDSSGATSEASEFFSGFTTDTFGLTSIITAPLNLIGSITSSTCTPLGLPLPYVNKTLELPCMSSIYSEYFGSFFTIYQTITFGIIAYWVCVRIFNLVKDFKNPDHDEIEVLDL